MASLISPCADVVTLELNEESFGQEFTAVRKWLVNWTLPELVTLRVTVVPGPVSYEPLDRRRDDCRYQIDIAVQKKIDPSDDEEVDPLVDLAEEFVDHFRGKELTAGSKRIVCTRREFIPGSASAIVKEHLDELRAFTAVVRTTWAARS